MEVPKCSRVSLNNTIHVGLWNYQRLFRLWIFYEVQALGEKKVDSNNIQIKTIAFQESPNECRHP